MSGEKTKTTEQLLMEVSAQLVKVNDDLKKTAEDSAKELKNLGTISGEAKAKADELLNKQGELGLRLTDLEQKMVAASRGGGAQPAKSIGQSVVEHDDVKAFCAKNSRGSVKVNAAINSTSAADLVRPDRQAGIITAPERRMTIRDLLTPGRTDSNLIEFVKETGFTNSAAAVTEGNTKPQSTITFDLESSPVKTIAHWVQTTRQILADAKGLASHIDGRLRYGLMYKEELLLLKGDGVGANIHGLVPQATAYNPAFMPNLPTRIDELRLAMLQATLAEFPVTGIVLNPIDWAHIELTKDTQGRYIIANPTGLAGPNLWSTPIVETQAMDVGEFLTGAFKLGAQLFDREDATVEVSTEDRDNFIKNMVTILAEERLALAVYRPESLISGEFTIAT